MGLNFQSVTKILVKRVRVSCKLERFNDGSGKPRCKTEALDINSHRARARPFQHVSKIFTQRPMGSVLYLKPAI